jgi:hypothetical protein
MTAARTAAASTQRRPVDEVVSRFAAELVELHQATATLQRLLDDGENTPRQYFTDGLNSYLEHNTERLLDELFGPEPA